MFCVAASITILTCVIGCKEKVIELNGLSTLIENKRYFGICTILSVKMTKMFIIGNYFGISFLVFGIFHYTVLAIFIDYSSYDKTRHAVLILNNYLHFVVLEYFVLMYCLYRILFRKCLTTIKILLIKHLSAMQEQKVTRLVLKKLPFDVKLRRLIRFYLCIVYNYKQLNSFMNPSFVIWWLTFVCLLVMHFYITVIVYFNDDHVEFIFTVRSYGSLCAILFHAIVCENMKRVVSFCVQYN